MKKTCFIILSAFLFIALSVWFSCNPVEKNGIDMSSILDELDISNSARLVITCAIEVNGATWDGGGQTLNVASSFPGGNVGEVPYPVFMVTNGTVKNFTLTFPAYDGIYLYGGNSSVENVTCPDIGEDIVTVKKPGTYIVSNCIFNRGEDKVVQISDLCTISETNISVFQAGRFMRQNGGKTWKMISYNIDCTFTDLAECVFRSDSTASTFFYRNLTTNCATIGYGTTKVAVY